MWSRTYSTRAAGLTAEQVWQVWADINQWHTWQGDVEYARLEGAFQAGNSFVLKPKGGPKVNIELVDVQPNRAFTDLTRFPLAKMYGSHEFVAHEDGLEIRTTMSIGGPLSFLWRKIVAEGIVNGLGEQTQQLIDKARHA